MREIVRQHERQANDRRQRASRQRDDEKSDYPQLGRAISIMGIISRHGPQTTSEIAERLHMTYRTVSRFVGEMHRVGFPIYSRRDDGENKWDLDWEKYEQRYQWHQANRANRKEPIR